MLSVLLSAYSMSVAIGQDTLTVERLDYKLVTLEDGRMSPVSSLESTDVAGSFFPCRGTSNFEFCSDSEFSIWVDGRFITEKLETGKCVHLTGEEMCSKSGRDTVFISIVSNESLQGVTARIFEVEENGTQAIYPKHRGLDSGFWKLGFILCGALLIVAGLFVLRKFDEIPKQGESYSERFFSVGNLVQLLITSILGGFLWSFTKNHGMVELLTVIGMVVFWWLVKTVFTLFSGALFKFRNQSNWQSNFLLQFWTLTFILLYVLLLLDVLFTHNQLLSPDRFRLILAVLELVFVVLVFFIFRLQKGIKSLHRFVYLCTTEILPGVLIIQLFLE